MITAETIKRIIAFDGDGLPVVSLYASVPLDPAERAAVRGRVSSLLHNIRPLAQDRSLEHAARVSVRADIERIEKTVGQERWKPGAVAIFSCSGRELFEEVPLPRAVRDRVIVDATPWVRPMVAVLDEYHRYCVAVIDKGSARIWELYQGELLEARKIKNRALRTPHSAPASAVYGVRNRADELLKSHYRRIATVLDELFRTSHYELLIVGGHQHEVPGFIGFLSRELRERVAGKFTVDPGTATLAEIRPSAEAIVENYERDEERRLVAEIMQTVAVGGPATLGVRSCLWAATVAAVQTLLVQEDAVVPGVVCDACGWLASTGETCALYGQPVRHTPDVIEEMVTTVIDEGGSIKHVQADTELKQHLTAASLRFTLPPEPTSPQGMLG
jgi:hypothetical protein